MLLGVGAASAGANSEIEGVWSFNGGQIGIQHLSNGTFSGTVVAETKFAECSHPVGQEIWKGITEQPDGSYWGQHQWYLGAPSCEENPVLGPTAWRVLKEPNGSRYLRVCFSHPGTSQPTIAADGAPKEASEYAQYHVTYGCFNSALTAPLPVAPGGSGTSSSVEHLTLPKTTPTQCLSGRLFKIRLKEPKYDPFKTVTITLSGHRIPDLAQRQVCPRHDQPEPSFEEHVHDQDPRHDRPRAPPVDQPHLPHLQEAQAKEAGQEEGEAG